MSIRQVLVITVCVVVSTIVSACASSSILHPATREGLRSFKGWELYAWREDSGWQFAILVGTNRLKADEGITDQKLRLADVAAVEARLSALAAGEWVTLVPRNRHSELLPEAIQGELKTFCDEHHLHWQATMGWRASI